MYFCYFRLRLLLICQPKCLKLCKLLWPMICQSNNPLICNNVLHVCRACTLQITLNCKQDSVCIIYIMLAYQLIYHFINKRHHKIFKKYSTSLHIFKYNTIKSICVFESYANELRTMRHKCRSNFSYVMQFVSYPTILASY